VYLVIEGLTRPSDVAAWVEADEVQVLNVGGNCEGKAQGIGGRVELFLVTVFRNLVRFESHETRKITTTCAEVIGEWPFSGC